jgi:phosphatidylserine/phosphatidylglycerophosphate/cardiolipin synthase-like enzyme
MAGAGATIVLLPGLHAKVFVCEAVPVGFGMVGSANLTLRSLHNYEVGVMFDGRGVLSPLLKELKWFASNDLRRRGTGRYEPTSRKGPS